MFGGTFCIVCRLTNWRSAWSIQCRIGICTMSRYSIWGSAMLSVLQDSSNMSSSQTSSSPNEHYQATRVVHQLPDLSHNHQGPKKLAHMRLKLQLLPPPLLARLAEDQESLPGWSVLIGVGVKRREACRQFSGLLGHLLSHSSYRIVPCLCQVIPAVLLSIFQLLMLTLTMDPSSTIRINSQIVNLLNTMRHEQQLIKSHQGCY